MAEWPNVPDSKSGVPQGTVGSNPTLSASKINNLASLHPSEDFLFFVTCRQSVGKLHKSSGPLPNWFCTSDLTGHRVDLRTPMRHVTTTPTSITVLHSLLRYLGIGSNVGEFRLRLRVSSGGHQNQPSQTPTGWASPPFGRHAPAPADAVIRSAEPTPITLPFLTPGGYINF